MKIGFLTFNLGDLNKKDYHEFDDRLNKSQLQSELEQMGKNVDMICISTQEDEPNSRFITWAESVLGSMELQLFRDFQLVFN